MEKVRKPLTKKEKKDIPIRYSVVISVYKKTFGGSLNAYMHSVVQAPSSEAAITKMIQTQYISERLADNWKIAMQSAVEIGERDQNTGNYFWRNQEK